MSEFIDKLLAEAEQAFDIQSVYRPKWQDIADVMATQYAEFTVQTTPGARRDQHIIDSHGVDALTRFARGLNGFLTPEGFPWLALVPVDQSLLKVESVKVYLQQVARRLLIHFHSPSSGFYTAVSEMYSQLGAFGTSPMFVDEDPAAGLPFYQSLFLGEAAFYADSRGNSAADFRKWKPTAWQLVTQFGRERMPHEVLDALKTDPNKKFTAYHIVRPRLPGDPVSFGLPFLSVYILGDTKTALRRPSGFNEDPILFPRWNRAPNQQYGFGPGENALGDVRMLQVVARDTAKGIHKSVDPNIITESDGTVQPRINMNPGGLWYADWQNGKPKIQQVPFAGNIAHGLNYEDILRAKIDKHFHLDAFELPPITTPDGADHRQSATEFAGRQRQQLQTAGPMLSRIRYEFLFPLVRRSIRIMMRNGHIPEPPQELLAQGITPEYVSPAAVALGSFDADTIIQFMGFAVNMANVDPRVLMKINPERTMETLADALQVPRQILNTAEEFAALVEQSEEAAQRQAQAEQMKLISDAGASQADAISTLQGG